MPRTNRQDARFHGFLVIDKPAGITSHDVVSRVRLMLRQRAVGHTGTLDPAATGVLPIACGDATKVINVIANATKRYCAEITFGVETDSGDVDGAVVRTDPRVQLTHREIASALRQFEGEFDQQAPRFSAIRRSGVRQYEMARRGESFDPPFRRVTFHALELVDWNSPTASLWVECSAGTYIRSLAVDLARCLGTCGYLSNLVRHQAGSFHLRDAWTLGELGQLDLSAAFPTIALHPDSPISSLQSIIIDAESTARWSRGAFLDGVSIGPGTLTRVYATDGTWLGYGIGQEVHGKTGVQPVRVIADSERRDRLVADTLWSP
jgi:tRNA pseudouridine55 synthase